MFIFLLLEALTSGDGFIFWSERDESEQNHIDGITDKRGYAAKCKCQKRKREKNSSVVFIQLQD